MDVLLTSAADALKSSY